MAEPTSPANQGKWIESSEKNMMQARNLIRDMLTVVRNNEVTEASNKAAMQEADKREKEAKKAVVFNKAAAHEKVIATSFKCMQDIEDGILQTEDSLSKLTHERYRGFAYLQVCERRLELRQKRPQAEMFKDALTDALTSEKQALEVARKELLELEEQGKKIVTELRDKRKFLSEDTGIRRLQMMEDLKTLSPQVALPPVKASASPKNNSNNKAEQKEEKKEEKKEENIEAEKVEKSEEPTEAAEAERPVTAPPHMMTPEEQKKAEQASKELIADTMKLLEKTSCHRNKSLETVFKVKQDTSRANHRSEDCLSRRTGELAEMKKQLEKHALDVEAAILRAERSLERTERRLDVKDNKKVEKFKQSDERFDGYGMPCCYAQPLALAGELARCRNTSRAVASHGCSGPAVGVCEAIALAKVTLLRLGGLGHYQTRNSSSFIRKNKNVPTMTAEPGRHNLQASLAKYSGLAGKQVLGLDSKKVGKKAMEFESIVLTTRSKRKGRQQRPGTVLVTTGIKKGAKKGPAQLKKIIAQTYNRPELLEMALAKYAKIKRSFKKKVALQSVRSRK
ncbi:Rpl28 [Symbiodinium natans]|uniref:Rpl28 protein n=1 Tax=Symbiodinium natans TaxID=878477 RepID=A0A812R023_9DINO|nr:Rpl28 [Symbiodinium natans]